jgi:hypothetical protein
VIFPRGAKLRPLTKITCESFLVLQDIANLKSAVDSEGESSLERSRMANPFTIAFAQDLTVSYLEKDTEGNRFQDFVLLI